MRLNCSSRLREHSSTLRINSVNSRRVTLFERRAEIATAGVLLSKGGSRTISLDERPCHIPTGRCLRLGTSDSDAAGPTGVRIVACRGWPFAPVLLALGCTHEVIGNTSELY